MTLRQAKTATHVLMHNGPLKDCNVNMRKQKRRAHKQIRTTVSSFTYRFGNHDFERDISDGGFELRLRQRTSE